MIERGSSLFEICGFAVQATRARHFLSSRSTSERKIFNTERLVNKKQNTTMMMAWNGKAKTIYPRMQ